MLIKRIKSSLAKYCAFVILGITSILLVTSCSDDDPTSSSLPQMVVGPTTIVDTATEGETRPDPHLVTVSCVPHAVVDFSFDCNYPWMTLSNLAGTDCGVTKDSFAVSFSVADLPVGVHSGTIAVRSDQVANSPQTIHVTYTIEPQTPDLIVSPHSLAFSASSNDEILSPDTFMVACGDDSNLEYTLTTPQDWITLSGFSGTTPDTIVVNVDPALVSTGDHLDTIWVSSDDMLESPQIVVVNLLIPSWLQQTSSVPIHPLKDVSFVDGQNGLAVGCIQSSAFTDGFIMKTEDGGDHWSTELIIYADYNEHNGLYGIDIVGTDVWAVGEAGTIYHSGNMGTDWENQSTGLADTTVGLVNVAFITADLGWIVGEEGLILTTADGGENWVEQTSGVSEKLYGISFIDESNGWVAGNNDVILRTTDGGENWEQLTSGVGDLRDVFFVDALSGWVVGKDGGIAHTVDGGDTWTDQESDAVGWLHSLFFINDSVGWIAGEGGVLLYTDDAGATWSPQESRTTEWLNSVFFVDEFTGWFMGDHGVVFHTTSGGN